MKRVTENWSVLSFVGDFVAGATNGPQASSTSSSSTLDPSQLSSLKATVETTLLDTRLASFLGCAREDISIRDLAVRGDVRGSWDMHAGLERVLFSDHGAPPPDPPNALLARLRARYCR